MLPAAHRVRTAAEFRFAIRRGRRAGSASMVVHRAVAEPNAPVRVGFVVSRSVGNAVTRNLVKRRLRHLMRDRLDGLGPGSVVVVRALPPAATASYSALAGELDRALARLSAQGNS